MFNLKSSIGIYISLYGSWLKSWLMRTQIPPQGIKGKTPKSHTTLTLLEERNYRQFFFKPFWVCGRRSGAANPPKNPEDRTGANIIYLYDHPLGDKEVGGVGEGVRG